MKIKSMIASVLVGVMVISTCLVLAGCAKEESTGMPNPMTEVTKQEMVDQTGIDIDAPQDAKDVKYFVYDMGEDKKMAEVQFSYQDKAFSYRADAYSEDANDSSGMNYEWEDAKEVQVAYNTATAMANDESAAMYWYDVVPGINYSLSCSNACTVDELTAVANTVFVSAQGNADGFVAGGYINGNSEDRDLIKFTEGEDGKYAVVVDIHRLTEMEGTAVMGNGEIEMTLKDAAGNDMKASFVAEADGTYTFKVVDSSWDLLPTGEQITGFAYEELIQ